LAGAVMLGKLKTTEQAFARHHPSVAPPLNPWGEDLWRGVSSSGSGVATAAGLAFGTLGSDTGGSIRFPSAVNGITGLKPTRGRVSRYGVFPLADSLDHVGPMTRSVVDAAIMLGAIAGQDPNDASALSVPVPDYPAYCSSSIAGLRIGLPHSYATDGVDPEVAEMWEAAAKVFAHLGAIVRAIDVKSWRQASQQWVTLCAAEAAWTHRECYSSRKGEYGHSLCEFIERGQRLKAVDLAAASIIRLEFSARFAALFDEIDLLLIAATSFRPPTWAKGKEFEREDLGEFLRFVAPTNMTGSPTITFPAGFDSAGLPLAAQLVGAHLSEHVICQAAAAFQRVTDWHLRHPPEQVGPPISTPP
jgi:amidase